MSLSDDIKTALEELRTKKPYLFGKQGQRLEAFNPGTGTGSAETAAQRVARLQRQTGVGVSPFG